MTPGPQDAHTLYYADACLGVVHWHNVRVFFIAGALTAAHGNVFEAGAEQLLQHHPDGILSLTIMDPDAPMTSREMRERFVRLRSELGPRLLRSAIVIEGGGVWARTTRTLLRGLELLSPPKYRSELYAALGTAVSDMAQHARAGDGRPARAPELAAHIEAMRRRVRSLGAPLSASAASGPA